MPRSRALGSQGHLSAQGGQQAVIRGGTGPHVPPRGELGSVFGDVLCRKCILMRGCTGGHLSDASGEAIPSGALPHHLCSAHPMPTWHLLSPPSAPLPCSQKGGQNPFPTQPHAPDLGTSFSRLPGHSLEPFLSTPPNPASRESEAAHVCPAPGPGGSVCCIPAKPFLPLLSCPLQRPSPTTSPIHQPHLSWDQKHCRSPTLPTKPS